MVRTEKNESDYSEGYNSIVRNETASRTGFNIATKYLASCADEIGEKASIHETALQSSPELTNKAMTEGYEEYLVRIKAGEEIEEENLDRYQALSLHLAQFIVASEPLGASEEDVLQFVGDAAVAIPDHKVKTAYPDYI